CAGFLLAKPRIAARSALSGLPDLQAAMNRVGYRSADGGEPVARARRVKRRPREQGAVRQNFPEAMLRICPGYPTADGGEWGSQTAVNRGSYRLTDGGEPVARARRVKRRPRERGAVRQNFPEAMLRICPGYPTADGGEWGSQTAMNCGVTGLQTAVNL
ncbi:hypothetical protein FML32_26595, partial [Klebsiella oxytoca]|nr:hypothetical protein [Klebsiella oxytoca]